MKTQILFASGIILMALSTSSFAAVDKPMEHNHAKKCVTMNLKHGGKTCATGIVLKHKKISVKPTQIHLLKPKAKINYGAATHS
jgi:hypothetical protein